jgi:hypothetical protein
MKRLSIAVAVIAAVVMLYKLKYPTYSYRYRMTVNVEVDGKLRSGSSVIEVRVSKKPQFLPDAPIIGHEVSGEAVYVDIGQQRGLVALLASGAFAESYGYPEHLVMRHFKMDLFDGRQLATLPTLHGGWELASNELPTLVTFTLADDPATLKVVRPDQLEQSFGSGVHWRGVAIEMTTAPVNHGLEARLPFLVTLKQALRITDPTKFVPRYDAFIRDQ